MKMSELEKWYWRTSFSPSFLYLGHEITSKTMHKTQEKVDAFEVISTLTNDGRLGLQSFMVIGQGVLYREANRQTQVYRYRLQQWRNEGIFGCNQLSTSF